MLMTIKTNLHKALLSLTIFQGGVRHFLEIFGELRYFRKFAKNPKNVPHLETSESLRGA